MLVGALIMMFVTSPTLSALALAAIPAIVFPLLAYGRAVRRLSRAAQDRLADASAYAADNLGAVRTMHAFGQEATVSAPLRRRRRARLRGRPRASAGPRRPDGHRHLLIVSSIVGILWFGSRLVIGGEISGGRLGQFVLYAMFAAGAMAELSEVWGELAQAAGAAERLLELLAARPEIAEPAHPKPLPSPPLGTLAFATCASPIPRDPGISALNGVSFEVGRGETVAIVGPSGAGKSTIFNLILRFYDPQSGRVAVDGVPIAEVDPQAAAVAHRAGAAGRRPVRRHARREHPLRPARTPATTRSCGAAKAAHADGFIARPGRRATTPASASAASRCPAASASASRSPAPSCAMPRSCCSTRPPARSTPKASWPCRRRSSA